MAQGTVDADPAHLSTVPVIVTVVDGEVAFGPGRRG
jgi:hypothetical protein